MSSPAGLGDSSSQASCLFGLALCAELFCDLASEIPYSLYGCGSLSSFDKGRN